MTPRMRAPLIALALAFGLSQGFAGPAKAQEDPAQTAREATRMLQDAAEALSVADGARDRVEALSETVRAYEHGLESLRAGIRQAALREQTILLLFEAERTRLAQLLGVLQRLDDTDGPISLLHPDGALGTARLGMIVADVTPAVADQAVALRAQLEELAVMRALQDSAVGELESALRAVQTARAELSQAIADRVDLPQRFDLDTGAMAQLAANTDSMASFAELLAETPVTVADADLPRFAQARGTLPLPALGALLRNFEEADAAGIARPGVLYAVAPGALVTAPWPGSIRYAGPLLDFGNVVILEPDADFLVILGGLGDLFVTAGELVPGSAPLGLMPGENMPVGADLITPSPDGGSAGLSETLYMELRQGGSPINPLDWFAVN